jgi:hypothetical protein
MDNNYIKSVFFISFLFVYSISSSFELDESEFIPRQYNNQSCQSYALALALHFTGDPRYFIQDTEPADILKKLRVMELEIRERIEYIRKLNNEKPHRRQWAWAIENLTFNKYTVKYKWMNTLANYYSFLEKNYQDGPFCTTVAGKCVFNQWQLHNNDKQKLLLISTKRIYSQRYDDGHIVSVLDYEGNYNQLYSYQKPKLKIVNSWSKTTPYTCTPISRGSVATINDYDLTHPIITWIEKK